MAQQLQVIDLNSTALALPAHLINMPAVVGTIAQGDTRDRIGLKGREFHIFRGGIEEGVLETKHADVIIVGAYPHISRRFFNKPYEDGVAMAPACYSKNGVVPEANSREQQSGTCQACPQNMKGSSLAGGEKSKACGFFRHLVVLLSGDLDYTMFEMDLISMSLWDDDREGKGNNGKFSFTNYAKKLAAHHIDAGMVITRLSFTSDSVPALQFQAIGYIDQEQSAKVVELVESGAVKLKLDINVGTYATDAPAIPPAQIAPPRQPPPAPQTTAPAPRTPPPQVPSAARVPAPTPRPPMARPAPPRVTPVANVAMPVEQDEETLARANPALQPTMIRYGQRGSPAAPLVTTRPAMRQAAQVPKATPQEVQQDVDALIAELDG